MLKSEGIWISWLFSLKLWKCNLPSVPSKFYSNFWQFLSILASIYIFTLHQFRFIQHWWTDIHDQHIIDRTYLASDKYELRSSVVNISRRIIVICKVRTLQDHLPGASSITEQVMFGWKMCVMDIFFSVITEVLNGGQVGQSHVRGWCTGLLGHIVHTILVWEVVWASGALTSSPNVLLVPKQSLIGAEVIGQHLSFSAGGVDCLNKYCK